MSASESVRDAVQWLMATGELQRLVRDEIAPVVAEAMSVEAIATARAEGETAGYAKGRREAFSEAAEIAERVVPLAHTYASENADLYRAQDDAVQRIADALRAKADAEAPHE